jgi:glycosyltransferase involved in cell wall biosynthesis
MKQVPEARLVIAGDGGFRPSLESLAASEQINNVEFVGSKSGAELEKLFSGCRFVVVPSIWHENFPYVMMEAFARGKAVVGSDKGGIPEYIEEGITGHVYPSNDPEKLAACIRNLWSNPSLAKQMGQNAKDYADKLFTDSAFYNRLLAIYQDAMGVQS